MARTNDYQKKICTVRLDSNTGLPCPKVGWEGLALHKARAVKGNHVILGHYGFTKQKGGGKGEVYVFVCGGVVKGRGENEMDTIEGGREAT